jgi:hypothetical protein
MHRRRWTSFAGGIVRILFVGVLILNRPGFGDPHFGTLDQPRDA